MIVTKDSLETPVASVIIPCFNGIKSIGKTLEAIRNQQCDFPFEVIVVDSSNDGTDHLIAANFPEVNLIHLASQTYPGSGRNLGIKNARGKYVAFTDSDCLPAPDWLARIVAQHAARACAAVGGAVVNGYPRSPIAWVSHLIEFNEWSEKTPEGFVSNIPSCNISYNREIFASYKIEFTDVFPTEDTIFNWSLTKHGGKIFFDPRIKIVHLSRMKLSKLLRHQFHQGQAVSVERQITDLPGKLLLKYPVLCLGIPAVRWLLALSRLLKHDRKTTVLFLALSPLYLAAAIAWTLGFMAKGVYQPAVIHIHDEPVAPSSIESNRVDTRDGQYR